MFEAAADVSADRNTVEAKPRRAGAFAAASRYTGVFGLAVVVVVFGLTLRDGEWFTSDNLSVILSEASIVGLLALAATIPMSAGLLDISFANVAGFAMGFLAWLRINTPLNDWLLVAIVIAVATLFGVLSGVLVAAFQLPSLVVTLGMSLVALAATQILLNGATLYPRSELSSGFLGLGVDRWGWIPVSAVLLAVVAIGAYLWVEHTRSGRQLLAIGGNPIAARLAGVRVARFQILSLTLSATISAVAGVLLLSTIGTADDVSAPTYLLPAIAAVFLGSTQVRSRFNVTGTIVAVIVIQTGLHGIQLAGLNQWVNYVFDGAVLLFAVVASRGSSKYAF